MQVCPGPGLFQVDSVTQHTRFTYWMDLEIVLIAVQNCEIGNSLAEALCSNFPNPVFAN